MKRYLQSCKTEFWRGVFKKELEYILTCLTRQKSILTIGCGPAIIERGLDENGFKVTGLDVSDTALGQAPDSIRKVVGSAEEMAFGDDTFDAAIYVASLQFIVDYEGAIRETARALKDRGKLLVMLLNPGSEFVRNKLENEPGSYMQKMRHGKTDDIPKIETAIANYFDNIRSEHYLGIRGNDIFESSDPSTASLYIIQGECRKTEVNKNARRR